MNGSPPASAIGRRSSWLDTTATRSAWRLPARHRKMRSLRQWPIFETITSTRCGLSSANWKSNANSSATSDRKAADSCVASVSVSPRATNSVRRKSACRMGSSNCRCSTMSQPCPKRNAVTAWTMPGRSGQLNVRMNVFGTAVSSAFDDVDSEAATRCLLVLVLHVRPGLAHGLDRLVERDELVPVTVQGHPGRGDGFDRTDGVAFDARDLHKSADRIAGQPEVVLDADLCGVLDLVRCATEDLRQAGRGHRARRSDLALTAHLGARDRGVLLEQDSDRRGSEQEPHDTVVGVGVDEVAVVVQDGRDDPRGAVGRGGDHPSARGVLL